MRGKRGTLNFSAVWFNFLWTFWILYSSVVTLPTKRDWKSFKKLRQAICRWGGVKRCHARMGGVVEWDDGIFHFSRLPFPSFTSHFGFVPRPPPPNSTKPRKNKNGSPTTNFHLRLRVHIFQWPPHCYLTIFTMHTRSLLIDISSCDTNCGIEWRLLI